MRSVNLGRWSRWIERYFNIKGGGGLMDVDQSIRVILPIASGTENRYLEGWAQYSITVNVGAVAAQFSRIRLRNPATSGVIGVVEMLSCWSIGSATDQPIVTWGLVSSDLANTVSTAFTRVDPRGQLSPVSTVSFNQQAAGGSSLLQLPFNATNLAVHFIQTVNQELVNLPGQAIDIQSNVANQQLLVTLRWRERALEASELT